MKRKLPEDFGDNINAKIPKCWKNRFTVFPNLERLSLISVITALHRPSSIHKIIIDLFFCFPKRDKRKDEWHKVTGAVKRNISILSLPKVLEKEALGAVQHVSSNILRTLEFQRDNLYWDSALKNVFWTPYATIDWKRLAKLIVDEGYVDYYSRLGLAVKYCLEEDVIRLWSELPEEIRAEVKVHEPHCTHFFCQDKYWICRVTENYASLDRLIQQLDEVEEFGEFHGMNFSRNGFMTLRSLIGRDEIGFRYFWERLTTEEKNRTIVTFTVAARRQAKSNGNVVCFLLSKMDQNQQKEYFSLDLHSTFELFITNWQWKHLFPVAAEVALALIDEGGYLSFMENISTHVILRSHVTTFFLGSPSRLKALLFDDKRKLWQILDFAFSVCDFNTINVIVGTVSSTYKEAFIKSDEGIIRCIKIIRNEEVDRMLCFLNKVLNLTLPSAETREAFKMKLFNISKKLDLFRDPQKVDHILHWCLSYKTEGSNFKKMLPYISHSVIFEELLRNEGEEANTNSYLSWCFDDDEFSLRCYKHFLPYANIDMMREDLCNANRLASVLNWCFLGNDELVSTCLHVI